MFLFTVNDSNSPKSYWLGLMRNANNTFQWVDGTFLDSFQFWNEGDGKNTEERCAIIGHPTYLISEHLFRWYDVDCAGAYCDDRLSGYICQRNISKIGFMLL